MDSLTHVLLGAGIGAWVMDERIGKKALVWGALAATMPDMDVVLGSGLTDVDKLIFHRGITHSFFVALSASALFAWLCQRLNPSSTRFSHWYALWIGNWLVHILLDSFTSYGTQLFQPFHSHAVAFSTIAILDPLFSLALLIPFWFAWKWFDYPSTRRLYLLCGFLLASSYLGMTVGNKLIVDRTFEAHLAKNDLPIVRYSTKPTLFQNALWRCTADDNNAFHQGFYSLLEPSHRIRFTAISPDKHLLQRLPPNEAVARFTKVTQGIFTVEERGDLLILNDLRFGRRSDWNTTEPGEYVFGYGLYPSNGTFELKKEPLTVKKDVNSEVFWSLYHRIKGTAL